MRRLIVILILCLLASSVAGMGVAPSRKTLSFSQDEISGSFRVINDNHEDMQVAVYARGQLKEYVFLDTEVVPFSADDYEKTVSYTLELPRRLPPGENVIEVFAVKIDESEPEDSTVVQTNLGVIHKIIVEVPYPGKYVQGLLFIEEAQPGERVTFTGSLSNLGDQTLEKVSGTLVIKDSSQAPVAQLTTNQISLSAQSKGKVVAEWVADVNPGTYHAEMLINYDGNLLVMEKKFDVGKPLIEVKNIQVAEFKLGSIAKFDIVLENKWNDRIEEVKTQTVIYDKDANTLDDYQAAPVAIESLSSRSVSSYWDTEGLQEDQYVFNIQIGYLGRVEEKNYEIAVSQDAIEFVGAPFTGQVISEGGGTSSLVPMLMGLVIVLAGITAFLFIKSKKSQPPAPAKSVDTRPKLKDPKAFIHYNLDQGISPKSIKKKLVEKGYDEEEVEEMILDAE